MSRNIFIVAFLSINIEYEMENKCHGGFLQLC